MTARIGILALQGDFAAHARTLGGCGVETLEVRRVAQLEGLDGLIIPGGESTTLLNLMRDEPWFDALQRFHAAGGALFGTCAGAILLSNEVVDRDQRSLGLIETSIERNAYGRQIDSFEAGLDCPAVGADRSQPLKVVFIRAPRFRRVGARVDLLAHWDDDPVLIRQGRVLAATFHPEITGDDRLHRYFVEQVVAEAGGRLPQRTEVRVPITSANTPTQTEAHATAVEPSRSTPQGENAPC